MKRILPIILTLCVIVSCLAIPAFAAAGNYQNDYTNGALYGKIINWQNYVFKSLPIAGQDNYLTTVYLPADSLWEIHDGGGEIGSFTYTSTASQEFTIQGRDLVVDWYTPYFISLEDINPADMNYWSFALATSHDMDTVKFTYSLYDQYKNFLSGGSLGSWAYSDFIDGKQLNAATRWSYGEDWAGAKYLKFHIEVTFLRQDFTTPVVISNRRWQIEMPFEYDPLRYPVDGLDAWMNGYFKPNVPDMNGENDIWGNFWTQQANLAQLFQSVRDAFQHYVVGFRVWAFVFSSFIDNVRLTWLKDLLLTSFALGAIAFLLDIAIQGTGKVSGGIRDKRKEIKREKAAKQRKRQRAEDRAARKVLRQNKKGD